MKSTIIISIIWLVFTFIFVTLGCSHWEQSKQVIPKLEVKKLLGGGSDLTKGGVSIEKAVAKDEYEKTGQKDKAR